MSTTPRVKLNDKVPNNLYFSELNQGENIPHEVTSDQIFKGKKVVIFGIPGAFTSVCSSKHLPQFIDKSKALKDKGVDTIACTAVNDPYVLREWASTFKNSTEILMLGDAEMSFHKYFGLLQNIPLIGTRGQRFSMYVDDGVIKVLNIEEPGPLSYKVSGPEHMLKDLEKLGL
ncbi:7784_t:CDS:2 [Funneliformis geosporum]|uniref:14617_t:CDS:1 n=1 Tax=Funneliformis geosporum TaxID=1117311 RepID=A0A9W4WQT2_9GLOM|nr:7784_t:CDS:2 [Funneliformis geosporum]CAI2179719.1 14617_t:CDS:2 [Funneliformis geosporum]